MPVCGPKKIYGTPFYPIQKITDLDVRMRSKRKTYGTLIFPIQKNYGPQCSYAVQKEKFTELHFIQYKNYEPHVFKRQKVTDLDLVWRSKKEKRMRRHD